jgi:hypothetical protein
VVEAGTSSTAHRSQLGTGLVRAQLVQVRHVVAAHHDQLGRRHQQVTAAAAAPSQPEGTDGVDGVLQSVTKPVQAATSPVSSRPA